MSEKPCPNCGHCPACGRSNLRPGPYPYLQPPYYPWQPVIWGGSTFTIGTTTGANPNQAVGSADYLSRLTNAGANAQNVSVDCTGTFTQGH